MCLDEADADGFRAFDRTSCRSKGTGFRINAENGHVVRGLVGGEQIGARRIDAEISRGLATGRFVLDEGKLAGFFVDGENGNAVVTTIGAVNEFARRVYANFGGAVVSRKILW